MTKYDDVSWHDDGLHIAFFLGWAATRGLLSPSFQDAAGEVLPRFMSRRATPAELLEAACDGKLTDEDLSDVGNEFAVAFYDDGYLDTYAEVADGDGWEAFDAVRGCLDAAFDAWRKALGR